MGGGGDAVMRIRSYGAVFKAMFLPTKTIVALKQVPMDGETTVEVKNEINIMKTLQSESCVQYYGSFTYENDLYVRDSWSHVIIY